MNIDTILEDLNKINSVVLSLGGPPVITLIQLGVTGIQKLIERIKNKPATAWTWELVLQEAEAIRAEDKALDPDFKETTTTTVTETVTKTTEG